MRTTLTLEDDLAQRLRDIARQTGQPFKDVVNATLRRGLSTSAKPAAKRERFVVKARACGFQPGIDPMKLNRLLDELEIERAVEKMTRDADATPAAKRKAARR